MPMAIGVAETRSVFLDGLHSPSGMTLVEGELYVANTHDVLRFPYMTADTVVSAQGIESLDLPGGPIKQCWTKKIFASAYGAKLYVSVASNSNIVGNGIDNDPGRAAFWRIDRATGASRVFASGLRNPVGMAWQPQTGALWTTVNKRDELGNDLIPDYMTSVRDGSFYGWPCGYFSARIDNQETPKRAR